MISIPAVFLGLGVLIVRVLAMRGILFSLPNPVRKDFAGATTLGMEGKVDAKQLRTNYMKQGIAGTNPSNARM